MYDGVAELQRGARFYDFPFILNGQKRRYVFALRAKTLRAIAKKIHSLVVPIKTHNFINHFVHVRATVQEQ